MSGSGVLHAAYREFAGFRGFTSFHIRIVVSPVGVVCPGTVPVVVLGGGPEVGVIAKGTVTSACIAAGRQGIEACGIVGQHIVAHSALVVVGFPTRGGRHRLGYT